MQGYQITFFTHPDRRHQEKPLAQWLHDLANELKLCGVTVDFEGCHASRHRPHAGHFPTLVDQSVAVVMTASNEKTDLLFRRLGDENVQVFYVKTPIEFGQLGHSA